MRRLTSDGKVIVAITMQVSLSLVFVLDVPGPPSCAVEVTTRQFRRAATTRREVGRCDACDPTNQHLAIRTCPFFVRLSLLQLILRTPMLESEQAHLTPHHRPRRQRGGNDLDDGESAPSTPSTSRPSRNRRPPAWIENDGVVMVATPPQHRNVVVEMKRSRNITASPSRKSFRRENVGGPAKKKAAAVQEDDSSGSDSGSDSGSGSNDSGSSEDEKAPQTPSRRRQQRTNGASQSTPGKLRSGPLTPTTAKATPNGQRTPAATTLSKQSRSADTKTHPRPIKRPRLSGTNGQTPRATPRTPPSATKSTIAAAPSSSRPFVQPTSADYYFAAHASRRRASAQAKAHPSWSSSASSSGGAKGLHSLSALTPKDVALLSHAGSRKDPSSTAGLQSLATRCYRLQYQDWKSALFMGNDLLFYGVGSMQGVLDDFVGGLVVVDDDDADTAITVDAVVIRGRSALRSEEWIARIEQALDVPLTSTTPSTTARVDRILEWLSRHPASHLVIMVHALDSPSFLNPRARSHLQHLTSSTSVHLIASTSHPNAHFLDGYVRHPHKHLLWVPCTTLVPMLDDALLSGAGVKLGGLPRQFDLLTGSGGGPARTVGGSTVDVPATTAGAASAASLATQADAPLLTSASAIHVLKSVTTKARALFNFLANELFKSAAAAASDAGLPFSQRTVPYSRLHTIASRNFLASSEAAVRSLLVEFTSHGLIRVAREPEKGNEEHVAIRIATMQEVKDVVDASKKM